MRPSTNQVHCVICGDPGPVERYPDELGSSRPTLDYSFSRETRKTFRIVECGNCTHQFVDPMPELESSYSNVVDSVYLDSGRQRVATARYLIKRLMKFGATSNGYLLDVGCNTGFFLDEAAKYFRCEGIELSGWAADIARERHKVHSLKLAEFQPAQKFDVVTLLGVIEHFEDPLSELERIAQLLSPNGLLVIFTGTRDSLLPRLLKKSWWWYQGMHLQYFTKTSLEKSVKLAGFDPLMWHIHTAYFSLRSLRQSALRYPMARLLTIPLLAPGIRNLLVPIKVSGESVLIARRLAEK